MQKFKETGDSKYIYQSELDKACYQHDMVCADFKDFPRRIACNKILSDEAFNINKNPSNDRYQRGFDSMAYKCLDKKSSGGAVTPADKSDIKSEIMLNQYHHSK